jgi:hypothetical protein
MGSTYASVQISSLGVRASAPLFLVIQPLLLVLPPLLCLSFCAILLLHLRREHFDLLVEIWPLSPPIFVEKIQKRFAEQLLDLGLWLAGCLQLVVVAVLLWVCQWVNLRVDSSPRLYTHLV